MIRPDPQAVLLAAGMLYVSMPITVWSLLHRRHARPNLELWCLSGGLFATGLVLLALRGQVADWVSVALANAVGFASMALKVGVLRLESGRRAGWRTLSAATLLVVSAQVPAMQWASDLRAGSTLTIYALYATGLTLAAFDLSTRRHSRSARLMAWLFLAFGAACALRTARLVGGWADGTPLSPQLDFLAVVVLVVVAMVTANIGFMGLALDRVGAVADDQRQTLESLRESQQAMELAARTREAVATERARTTRLLAHEVRQPLHNAAVALQSGIATLAHSRDPAEAAGAIEQAQAVIRRVSATLDNTVAATTLLAADGRISTADTDLQMLIDLCLGDLPLGARARIHVDYRADARSARLEASLMRLALRNLLTNATLYAPGDSPVELRVLDSDEPLALVLEVADLGPGIADGLRERIFDEGVRGPQPTMPGYGLGLHVVKRVARLHGGSIEWRANEPQGSVFRLTLPQGDPA